MSLPLLYRYRIWKHNRSRVRKMKLALIEVSDMIEEMRRHVKANYKVSAYSACDYVLGVHMSRLVRWRGEVRGWLYNG